MPEPIEGDWGQHYTLVWTLSSAIEMLRSIAAMGKKAGSESAKNWLLSHGYPLEEGGYIPGKGFES